MKRWRVQKNNKKGRDNAMRAARQKKRKGKELENGERE